MEQMLTPEQWASQEFGQAELGDLRRTRRLLAYAAAAAAAPAASIPQQCGCWKATKAVYRLLDVPEVDFVQVLQPHWQRTSQQVQGCRYTLALSDSSTLSFDHPATAGLGPTCSQGQGRGLLLHSTLAVDVSAGSVARPQVLGLLYQQLWARPPHGVRAALPESVKWANAITALGPLPATHLIHVADAEADCWEALEAAQRQQVGFVFRACQDRNVATAAGAAGPAGTGPGPSLFALARAQAPLGGKWLWVRSRPQREPRWAKLLVASVALTLQPPVNWSRRPAQRKQRPRPAPLSCWCVRVWEIDAPEGEEPIEWVLLSSEPAADLEAALQVAYWYSCRWLIEEYHKCLKSGCRVEQRQLEDVTRLAPLTGILTVVAVRLLQLKHQARSAPQAPAESVVPERYVATLRALLPQLPVPITVGQFWREVAKLGGFLARKGDGDPGWITLWRGWWHLELLTQGRELAHPTHRQRCG